MEEVTLETADRELDPLDVRRSFRLLFADAILYTFGLAFLDQSTVLPAFLSTLTSSNTLIGGLVAIRSGAWFIPQLWVAHYLRDRRLHKPFLLKVASVSRIGMAAFAGVLFLAERSDRALMLWSFLAMYTAFWLSEGCASVPWTDLVGKTIPERLRGRLFGLMQFAGGLLAIGAGVTVGRVLSSGLEYPTNYGVLAALAAVFLAASFACVAAVREPDVPAEEHEGDFLEYIRKVRLTVAAHPQLKQLIAIQILIGFFGMSLPFYVLYAKETIGLTGKLIGLLLSIQMVGCIVSSAAAGYASDRFGPKSAILIAVCSGILSPVLMLAAGGASLWVFAVVFLAIGSVLGSGWLGVTNFLLELADARERRSFIGIMNTANTPTMVFPLIGGVIVQTVSYQAAFAVTAVALSAALIMSLRLRTNRDYS